MYNRKINPVIQVFYIFLAALFQSVSILGVLVMIRNDFRPVCNKSAVLMILYVILYCFVAFEFTKSNIFAAQNNHNVN